MRRAVHFLLLILLVSSAFGQSCSAGRFSVQASRISYPANLPLHSGTLSITGVDANRNSISFGATPTVCRAGETAGGINPQGNSIKSLPKGATAVTGPRYRISGFTAAGSRSADQLGETTASTDATGNHLTISKELRSASVNAVQAVGNGTINTNIAPAVNAAIADNTATGATFIPPTYSGTDVYKPINTQRASGLVTVCSGAGSTVAGQLCSVTPVNVGSYPACPTTPATLTQGQASGSPAIITASCTLIGGRYQVTGYNIVNTTGLYGSNDDSFTASFPAPPANAQVAMVDQRNGALAFFTATYVDSFGCPHDGVHDDTPCINAALNAARAKAAPLSTNPHVIFGGGEHYLLTSFPSNFVEMGDDGTPPPSPATCNGSPCVALAPMTPAVVPCSVQLSGNELINLNGATLQQAWANTVGLNDGVTGAMFCGSLYGGFIQGPGTIYNSFAPILLHSFFQHSIVNNIYMANVGMAIKIGYADRSTISNLTSYGLTGIIIGGDYTARSTAISGNTATNGGYCDTCTIAGNIIINQQGDYNDTGNPIAAGRIPNRCTGVVPSSPAHVSLLHQMDDYFDYTFSASCVNPIYATNTTAIPGITFQLGAVGAAGNADSIVVDATTHTPYPISFSGTVTTLYALNAAGANRTLGGLAAAINGYDGTGTPTGGGQLIANVTGTSTANISANTSTSFSGGANSSRLADGTATESYTGAAGKGFWIDPLWFRPSNLVSIYQIQCEGSLRHCVDLGNAPVNGLSVGYVGTEGTGYCSYTGGGGVFGSVSTCPDPLNFFTVPNTSAVGPINTSAIAVSPASYGQIREADGYGTYAHGVTGKGARVGVELSYGNSASPPITESQQILNSTCTPTSSQPYCNSAPIIYNYSINNNGLKRSNQMSTQIVWDTTYNSPMFAINQIGNLVGLPTSNQGAVVSSGFGAWSSLRPTQYPYNADNTKGTHGTTADPSSPFPSLLTYRSDLNCWRMYNGTAESCLAIDGVAVNPTSNYTVAQGVSTVFTSTAGLTVTLPTLAKDQYLVIGNGGSGVVNINLPGSNVNTSVPSSIPGGSFITLFGGFTGRWYQPAAFNVPIKASALAITGLKPSLASPLCVATSGAVTNIGCNGGGIANTTFTVSAGTTVGANTCLTASSVIMMGVAATSVFEVNPSADNSAVIGWMPGTSLYLRLYPTANTLNYRVCNGTDISITTGASVVFNVGAR